ncbi:MAG: hypothetical protein HY673_14225 [Chloroflexi bacterium]|nr:hypothetical protein [Chloroflexota bacterium]
MTSYYGVLATNLAVPEAAAAQESGPASVDRQADLVRAGVPVEELDIAVGADKIEILRQRLKEFYAAGVVPAYLYQAHMAELDAEETAEAMLSGEGGQRTD